MKKVLLLVFFGLLLAIPPTVLGQTATSATSFTNETTISSFGSSFTGYQTDNIISVPVNGGEIIFDKANAGVTIYDKDGVVVDSDSYSVRASQLNQDAWEHLSTNDATPTTDVWIDPFGNTVVTYTKEDIVGKFVVEYVITEWTGKIKTTAYFTNYTLFNHKIAFTETLQLVKDVKINGQVVDLNQYVGVTFDRETLEANQDIVIEARESIYNSGLGFENLWSVSIFDDRMIALDYANVGETQTGIGETASLDPTIILAPTNVTATQDPTTGEVTVSFDAPPSGSDVGVYFDGSDYMFASNNTSNWSFMTNTSSNWSASFWVKLDSTGYGSHERIFANAKDSTTRGIYVISQTEQVGIGIAGSNGTTEIYSATGAMPRDDTWHQVTITYDKSGNTVSYYLDGSLHSTSAKNPMYWNSAPYSNMHFGARAVDFSGKLHGALDEFAIWNTILTPSEVASLYSETTTPNDIQTDNVKVYYDFSELSGNFQNKATGTGAVAGVITGNNGSVDRNISRVVIADPIGYDVFSKGAGTNYREHTFTNNATFQITSGSGDVAYEIQPNSSFNGINAITNSGGNSWDFNGSNNYVTYGSTLSDWNFLHDNTDKTVSMWLSANNSNNKTLLQNNVNYTTQHGFSFSIGTSDQLRYSATKATSQFAYNCSTSSNFFISDGSWHNYSWVIDNTAGTVTFYRDGGNAETCNSTSTPSSSNANYSLPYMAYMTPYSSTYSDFTVDNLIMWNTKLTESEIQTIAYSNGSNGIKTDNIKGEWNFEQTGTGSGALTNIATGSASLGTNGNGNNFSATTGQSSYSVQSVNTGTTNLSTGSYNVSGNVVLTYDDDEITATGGTENSWNIPALIGTTTTNTHDYNFIGVGASADGTNNGATTGVTGKIGNAWEFNDSSYGATTVTLPLPTDWTNSDWSISIWTNSDDAVSLNNSGIISNRLGSTQSNWFTLGHATWLNGISVEVNGGNIQSGVTPTGWHNSVLTYDESTNVLTLFVDGVNEGTVTNSNLGGTANTVKLGQWHNNSSTTNAFDGKMDEFTLYDKILSQSEITALYNGGSGDSTPDSSGLLAHYDFEDTGNTLTNIEPTQTFQITSGSGDVAYTITPSNPVSSFNGVNGNLPLVIDEDFSTSTGWTVTSPHVITNGSLEYQSTGGLAYYDLGTALDNSQWVMRFKHTPTTLNNPSGNWSQAGVGLSNNVSGFTASQDFVGINPIVTGSNLDLIRLVMPDNNAIDSTIGTGFNTQMQLNTPYYIEITRLSATQWKAELFSDANYSNSLESQTNSISSGVQDLRYFKTTYKHLAGLLVAEVDDIKIWDGVTSVGSEGNVIGTTNLSTGTYNVVGDVSLSYDDSLITATGGNESVSTTHSVFTKTTPVTTYNLSNATYTNDSFDISTEGTNNIAFYMRADGLKFYVSQENGKINEYDLTTAYDLSTASYSGNGYTHNLVNPKGLFFSDDGTKMYLSIFNSQLRYTFVLSTAWDVSTVTTSYNHGYHESQDLFYTPDGLRAYSSDNAGNIKYFTLNSAWNQYHSSSSSNYNPSNVGVITGFTFSPDGKKLFTASFSGGTIYQHNLPNPWDLGTMNYVGSFDISSQDSNVQGMAFSGDYLYVLGQSNDKIFKYNTFEYVLDTEYSEMPIAGITEEYTVTATGLSENIIPVVWQNAGGGISINGNTITKSGDSWANGVQGTTTFSSSEGAELVFNVGSNSQHSFVGFGKDPFVADSSDIQYVLYPASNGTICFYENNVQLASLCNNFTYSTSDDLKVKMDSNGVVTYWKNETLLYTSTLPASGTYYAQASLYSSGVTVSANFIEYPEITSSPSDPAQINTFNVPSQVTNVTAVNGTPIGITWSTGQAGAPVNYPVPYPDTLGSSADGTNNGATTGVTGKIGNAWDFDGVNDYVDIGNNPYSGNDPSTIGFWINSDNDAWGYIVGMGNPSASQARAIGNGFGGSTDIASVHWSNDAWYSPTTLTVGNWHYVTSVYDGSTTKLYVDTVQVGSTHSTGSLNTTGSAWKLGVDTFGQNSWADVRLDEMVFYNKALTTSEISALYNSGNGNSTPDTSGLLAHYDFEQTGNTLTNISSQSVAVNSPPVISYDVIRDGTVIDTINQTYSVINHMEHTFPFPTHTQTPVTWSTNVGTTSTANTVTQADSVNTWNHYAKTTETITAGDGNKMEFSQDRISGISPNHRTITGIGIDPATDGAGYQFAVDYGYAFTSTDITMRYFANTVATIPHTFSASDKVTFEINSLNQVLVKLNGTLIHTFANTATAGANYYAHYTSAGSGGSLVNVTTNLESPNTSTQTFQITSGSGDVAYELQPYSSFNGVSGGVGLGSSVDGTNNGATTGATGKIGNAWSFDGSNDNLTLGSTTSDFNFLHQDDWSVSFWMKRNTVDPNRIETIIANQYSSANVGFNMWMDDRSSAGHDHKLVVSLSNGVSGASTILRTGDGFIPKDTTTWYHYVATYDASTDTFSYYRDNGNTVSGVGANSPWSESTSNATYQLKIASNPQPANWNAMQLDELVFYDKVLSSSEISALYNSGNGNSTPDTDRLLAYYDFEDTGNTATNQADGVTGTTNLSTGSYNVSGDVVLTYDNPPLTATGGTTAQTSTTVTNPPATQYTDNTVVVGNSYDYQIVATAVVGSGVESLVSTAQTVSPANAPTNFTVVNNSSAQLVLDWTPSSDLGGGSLISMQIDRSTDGGSTWTLLATTSNTSPPYTDTTVVAGNTYHYRIASVNEAGVGTYSGTVGATAGLPPDAITNVVATIPDPNTQPHDVEISFSEPANWGTGVPQTYEIYESLTGTSGWTLVTSPNYQAGQFTTTVTISNVQPATEYFYKVLAVSSHATSADSNVDSVITADVPSQPMPPTIGIDDPDNAPLDITVNFVDPFDGGSAIKGWMIERHDSTTNNWSTIVANTANTNLIYHDTSVLAGTDYKYRVSAINPMGTSVASLESNLVTTPTIPSAPTGLTATTIDDASIELNWNQPTTNGGSVIQTFSIQNDASGTFTQIGTVGVGVTTFTHTGLSDGTNYNYQVVAVNNIGNSPASNQASAWTLPSAPTNLVANSISSGDTLELEWDQPTGTVVEYRVERALMGATNWSTSQTVSFGVACSGANCTVQDTGLSSGTEFQFRIVAVNLGGDSDYSNIASNWTVPSPPSGLGVTTLPNSSNTGNLSWTAPPSGTVTGYQIERESPIGGGFNVIVVDTGSTTTTYDDSTLTLTTEYNYRVSAINLGGVSLASNEASVTTLSPPTEPLDIVFDLQKVSDNLRVQVSWTAPVDLFGGVLSNYMVERNVDGAGWNFLTNSGTTPSIVDTDIQRGVNYEYRVSATTQIATGLPSVSNSLEFVDGTFDLPLTAIEGNTLESLSSFTKTTGDPTSYATNILIVKHDPNNSAITTVASDNNLINTNSSAIVNGNPVGIELVTGTTQLDTQYVYETSEFTYTGYLTTVQDGVTHIFESNSITVAPLNPFGGNTFANEFRDEITYQTSTVELYAEPAGYDAVIRYQHQDPSIEPFFYAVENVQATHTNISPVLEDKDFYVSVYINPEEFDFIIDDPATGLAHIECNEDSPLNCPAWDAVYTPSGEVTYSLNPTFGAIEDIPDGIQSDFVTKSFKSPDAPQSFGLEPLGDLFGMPMVFIFIIGLGAVFTGRSAQMGVIFIAVTIGIMIYMGYLSFDFGTSGLSTAVTWGIIIVSMIGGILVGKRWS